MNRADFLELIQRDLDGDLTIDEKATLERQLRIDPELQLLHTRLSRVSVSLEQLPKVTPPFSLVDSILPQLNIPTDEIVATEIKSNVVELPRLEKKSAVTAVDKPNRSIPVWLLKVSSGVVAASLMFGMYTMAHKAILSEKQDSHHGNRPVQEVNISNVPATKVEPPKQEVPVEKETTEQPGAKTNQSKPPITPENSAVANDNKVNPSPYKKNAQKDDKDKDGNEKENEKDKDKDKDKDKGNNKIKDPKTGKAVQPNDDKKATDGTSGNSNQKKEVDKNNGSKNKETGKDKTDNGKDKNNKGNNKEKDKDDDQNDDD